MTDVDLMSPEKVAAEYGGDKRKIGRAVQMGLIDPTVGVMAGMFIDRMRAAAAQEQRPTTTVAEETLSPAGLGATPVAQQMAPQMAAPAPTAPAAPPTEAGLAALPVPETVVPSYESGGIVAFADGGDIPRFRDRGLVPNYTDLSSLVETQQSADPFYSGPGGANLTLADLIGEAQERRRAIPISEAERTYMERLKGAPERAAKTKAESLDRFIAELGFRAAASKSPRALQAFGEAGAGAMPGLAAGAKEARELEESGLKGLAEAGRAERAQELAGITAGEQMFGKQLELQSRAEQAEFDRQNRMAIAMIPDKAIQVAEQLRQKNPNLSYLESITQASQALTPRDTYNATRNAVSAAAKDASSQFTARLTFDPKLQEDVKKANAGDDAARKRVEDVRNAIERDVFRLYQVEGVDLSSGRMGAPKANDPLGIR